MRLQALTLAATHPSDGTVISESLGLGPENVPPHQREGAGPGVLPEAFLNGFSEAPGDE